MYHNTKDQSNLLIKLGNNEVLKTLSFVDANATANAEGSIIASHERCSGKLMKR